MPDDFENMQEPPVISNDEYYDKISILEKTLEVLRKKTLSLTAKVVDETLYKEDLYYCAAADRNTHLIDGFVDMLKTRNLTCAGVLLRIQIDTCMRTYAAFIAQDRDALISGMIEGEALNKYLSEEGKNMTDGYLNKRIEQLVPSFKGVYNKASGYVHMSGPAFFQTVAKFNLDGTVAYVSFQCGSELPERRNWVLLQAADLFIKYVQLFHKMLEALADSKARIEDSFELENVRGESDA